MSNNLLKSIVNFDIDKATKDYTKFLETEQAETVMNSILLNYSENLGRIVEVAHKEMSEDILEQILQRYSNNMLKLWNNLQNLHKESYFEFNLDNPFKDELAKNDKELSNLLFK
ncbi:gp189 [Sphingomonas phage PAU]|uniref:gp189 n=1 Tax=Sphingomonas phage PAU TaxID=1150991 RepID=UPI000257335B|nr:gp189 [Sphingomonas phage PAU]AFF28187.1 gp189 [Sphingomonas phage PAU]